MFKERLISGIILIIILFAAIFGGKIPFLFFTLVLTLVGYFELYKVLNIKNIWLIINTYVFLFLLILSSLLKYNYFLPIILLFFLITVILTIVQYPKITVNEVMFNTFSYIYVGVLFYSMILTRYQIYGFYYIILIFIISWGCDTCAYCVGITIGKRKLAPVLSPKKSIEGAIGGIIGATILSVIYSYLVKNNLHQIDLYIIPVTTFFGSILSQFGDLFASLIKREYKIKDYGNLIRGHGGILDRFDSVLIISPVVYCIYIFTDFLRI